MEIVAGTRLGPYEIVSPIGAGGMGQVWRGKDTRLTREVAIKILPDGFARNEQFRTRFEREARTISLLNHPNICTLFDVGHESDTHFLVMELIEGETLAERISRGALPPDQVLRYGAQIADALDRAHKQGIVHRDLKPANVMIARTGAKLLDFGLARSEAGSAVVQGFTELPTQAKPLTQEGTILGTFQYMAPEQLEGIEADARSDIFALGALLYEMATGQRAFQGSSRTSLIAAIVSSNPAPISSVTPMVPPALDHIVRKCLEKDPDDRWQSAHDIAGELRWISEAGSQAGVATQITIRRRSRERLAWILAALLALTTVAMTAAYMHRAPTTPRAFRSTLVPPSGTALIPFDELGLALSPDGNQLAFVANAGDGRRQIWVRDLASIRARALPETGGASYPTWSPDGRYLAFFSDGKLKKFDLRGGSPQVLADAPTGRGISWGRDDNILYAPNISSSILLIPAAGGTPRAVTRFDETKEVTHRWPQFLPDGKHFFFVSRTRVGTTEVGRLMIASIDSPDVTKLIDDASNTVYVEPGYILFGRSADLLAWRFDLKKLRLIGQPLPVLDEKLSWWEPKNLIVFAAAGNGTIVYLPEAISKTELHWYGRDGRPEGRLGEAAYYLTPRISPDGRKVAVSIFGDDGRAGDLWLLDLEYERRIRLTQKSGLYYNPSWNRDGSRLLFVCQPKSIQDLCIRSLATGGDVEVAYESPFFKTAATWMPDGQTILFAEQHPDTQEDLSLLDLATTPRKAKTLLRTQFKEDTPELSPDGKWAAYISNESGRFEIFVRPSSGSFDQWQISTNGGAQPRWRRDGRELVYVTPDGNVMSVAIESQPVFRPGAPKVLFKLPAMPDRDTPIFEDLTPDGQRLLLNLPATQRSSVAFHTVQHWTSLLADAAH